MLPQAPSPVDALDPALMGRRADDPDCVLVVDDDPVTRRLVRETLLAELPGWRVLMAGDLARARALLVHHQPSCVILDLGLPDGEGTELLPDLQATSDPAVVVLTGRADPRLAKEMVQVGLGDVLDKARVEPEAIRACVAAAMQRRSLLRELEAATRSLGDEGEVDGLTALLDLHGLESAVSQSPPRAQWVLRIALEGLGPGDAEEADTARTDLAHALIHCTRPRDLLARVATDEFAVVLDALTADEAHAAVRRLESRLLTELVAACPPDQPAPGLRVDLEALDEGAYAVQDALARARRRT